MGFVPFALGPAFFDKGQLCKGFLHPLVWLEMDGAGLDGVCSICFGASFFRKRSAMQGVPPSVSLVRNGWRRFRWGLFHLLWGQLFSKKVSYARGSSIR